MLRSRYGLIGLAAFALCLSAISRLNAGAWRDDFEDGDLEGWRPIPQFDKGQWSVINGRLACSYDEFISTILVVGDSTWGGDYTVRVDVNLLENWGHSKGDGDVDLIARVSGRMFAANVPEGIMFAIAYYPERVYAVHLDGQNWSAVNTVPELSLRTWHHLRLDAKGKDFILSVNGEKVLAYTDDAIPAGGVGLGLARYTARFDNFEVTGPSVPDRTPPTWMGTAVEPRDQMATAWGALKRR